MPEPSRYKKIAAHIFGKHYKAGSDRVEFARDEINQAADLLRVDRVLNPGDLLYYFRSRQPLPEEITKTAPAGKQWIIETTDRGQYVFRLAAISTIVPQTSLVKIKIPDATPQIVAKYARNEEQALLAKLRYNRLIDIFLGIVSYSLQNHLRTQVDRVQIEIDELYVGVNRSGAHFVIPVQAKGGRDKITPVQLRQDLRYCEHIYPNIICRAVAAQFMTDDVIAMFELTLEGDNVAIVNEKHYKLVPSSELTDADLKKYKLSADT